ncbi:DUF2294 domain-containing protein [Paenibacillus sp. J22TS3]|uniref:DUF2294 domain-containing protein n=1 Tax=Paenibacillus sp. J22TS3 TaxID=2807192 RepID=UPI001B1BA511|nr:Na-translocating system protein MpsC family protein [Paenibacillus sp. J22TS3]GIP22004.1 hypothetical protein J22TS3_22790 [Paenibacillus sp. J22TS3]
MDQLHGQQLHQLIASFTGKMFRDHFGKGPESVIVSINHKFITIYLKNFLIPTERVLLQQNQELMIRQIRSRMMRQIIPELRSYLGDVLQEYPEEILYDWDYESRNGMLVALFPNILECGDTAVKAYRGRLEIERELMRISGRIQQEPAEISSYEINPRTWLVVRSGILGDLEKELIRMELGDLLGDVKRRLEKSYIKDSPVISSVLSRSIADCFIDWDYARDRSITVITTHPPRS